MRLLIPHICLCIGHALLSLVAYSQAPRLSMELLTVSNGLPANPTYHMIQDQLGYIWMGTDDGLARYDGYNFKNYHPAFEDSSGLKGSGIYFIHESDDGNLWLGSNWGLHYFDRGSETFTNIQGDSSFQPVHFIFEDSKGNIWTVSDNENFLFRWEADSETLTQMYQSPDNTPVQIGKASISRVNHAPIWEDSEGSIWVGTWGKGLLKYNSRNDNFLPLSIKEGTLPSDTIYSLFNHAGQLWIGTSRGLVKYDLNRGDILPFSQSDPSGGKAVFDIRKDSRGGIWLQQRFSITRMDPASDSSRRYVQLPELDLFRNQANGQYKWAFFSWIGEDHNGNIYWVYPLNRDQIYQYDPIEDRITTYTYDFKAKTMRWPYQGGPSAFFSGMVDHTGLVWLGYQGGVLKELSLENRFFTYLHSSTLGMGKIIEDRWGNIWITALVGDEIFKFSPENFEVSELSEHISGIFRMAHNSYIQIDGEDHLWYGRNPIEGLYTLDLGKNVFSNLAMGKPVMASSIEYRMMLLPEFAVDGDPLTRWGSDYSDMEWIMVDLEERFYLDHLKLTWNPSAAKEYEVLLSDDSKNWRLARAFRDGNGETEIIPIGQQARYLKLLFKKRITAYGYSLWEMEIMGKKPAIHSFSSRPNDPHSIPSANINDIMVDSKGDVWLMTRGGTVRYLPHEDRFQQIGMPDSLDGFWGIFEDQSGRIWIHSWRGYSCFFQPEDNQFHLFEHKIPDSYTTNRPGNFMGSRKGHYWFSGIPRGVFRIEPLSGDFRFYLPEYKIYTLFEDSKGRIWLGSQGAGIFYLDPESGAYQHYSLEDGLSSQYVNLIEEDELGRLWIASENGLSCFYPEEERFVTFGVEDGLFGNRITQMYKDSRGRIMLGGYGGFSFFDPNMIKPDSTRAKVILSGFKLDHQVVKPGDKDSPLSQDISLTQSITLPHFQNNIGIEFTALHFNHPQTNQYQVMMTGLDTSWIDIGAQRNMNYTQLAPGTYTFRVKGSNGDGIWSEEPATLQITIRPPWYWAWWSKTLYAMIVLGSLYLLRRYEMGKQQRELEQEQERLAKERNVNEQLRRVDQLKDQFLANTSHELRTPLQGIIGLSESLAERVPEADQKEDLSMIISSGKRLSNLVNDILDFSKLKNFDIQLVQGPVHLRTLVDIVLRNNAPLARGKSLDLINAIPVDLPAANADENRLQQVLYNLVGNAIKFTEKGHIKIFAEEKDQMLHVNVEDTGIGIPENKLDAIFQEFEQADGSISREFAGTGLGLSISKKLIELHGGTMWVESQVGEGSTFCFTIPISVEKATTLSSEMLYAGEKSVFVSENNIAVSLPVVSPGKDTIRILVVDDEPVNQQVLKNHLSGQGFHLTQALNGKEAIEAIQNNEPFDLILLDVMMPRMSGYEVCEKIRQEFLASELPVIMVTAKNQLQDIVQGLSLGANDYLPKPFHKEELLARINTQLDLHRINSVTSKFVPNEFLRSLGLNRITEASLGDQIEREVTVLFSDIRDYTSLSETMTPEENFRFVNAFHGRMGPIIQQHHGFVNQYLGDAIMAIFPDSSSDAVKAATEMQKCLAVYNLERISSGRKPLQMGIGLHTGSLIMGIIGDEHRLDAATISDTVNTASRLESLTKHYGVSILLSEDSLNEIEDKTAFNFRYLGKVLVKGKKNPVGIYECLDGDQLELRQQKLQTTSEFSTGLSYFFNRKFAEATFSLNQVIQVNPDDQVARLFLNRSARLIQEGVPQGWTGIESFDTK